MQGTNWRVLVVATALVAVALIAAGSRFHALDWRFDLLVPDVVYDVEIVQELSGRGERVRLRTFLPASDARQRIEDERNQSADLDLALTSEAGNRTAEWIGQRVEGQREVRYGFRARTRALRYAVDPAIPLQRGDANDPNLSATRDVQATAPEIVELSNRLVPADRTLLGFLRSAFDHVEVMGFRPFKGTTDALTALRLGEASCNGKSRLLVALLRAQGVPARLVGGVVLESGAKRTSHQWLEARAGGHWVPLDPTNGHFAETPQSYLALYRGDHGLFAHTSDIAFDYRFEIRKRLAPKEQVIGEERALGAWSIVHSIDLPIELLKILIMIPVGAVVVILFRNVVGLRTFGTFLPTLIAAAAHHTGLFWGALGFVGVIALASLVRRVLVRLQLLHSPQLAILLTTVVGMLLVTAYVAAESGSSGLAHIPLFPVAILAITTERFAVTEVEEGTLEAWKMMARTLVVVACCYVTMSSLSLQILFLAFPELLLAVVAIDMWLGRWMGLRVTEWIRFRGLLVPSRVTS